MIQSVSKYNENQHIVVVVNEVKNTPEEYKKIVEEKAKADSDFDYLKIDTHFVFFVKSSENTEKNRILGSKVRNLLPKEAKSIFIVGDEKTQLAIAEGIALSNYQFIQFFKDKDK
jgi:leucyl aminopeptidase